MTLEELQKKVEALEKKVNYPIDFNFQKTLEKVQFDEFHIKILKGGIPIYTGARAGTPEQGEIWIEGTALKIRIGTTTYTWNHA
jgi:hypothetical protein